MAWRTKLNFVWQYPTIVFVSSLLLLWLATLAGAFFRNRQTRLGEEDHTDLNVIVAASLTLLGLIVGFSFSMSTGRYDLRKHYEEEEANAIGTEYVRADLLQAAHADKVHSLLKDYLDLRLVFYETRDGDQLQKNDVSTTRLQAMTWAACAAAATEQPSVLTSLAASGMNDVLNSQGYTLASWRNTIPGAAWILMELIGVCCSALIGYSARGTRMLAPRFFILPLLISVSFFLIADIDSPRRGVIHVRAQNLIGLAQSLH